MRISILASRFPYPIEKGDKLRLYHQLRGLSANHEIHLIALNEISIDPADYNHLKQYCESIHILDIGKWKPKLSLLKSLSNALPFQVQYFYQQKVKQEIHNILKEIKPDVIYCQLIRMAEYVREINLPKVLDYMDSFSLSAERRVKHDHFFSKMFFKSEHNRVKKYEASLVKDFDQLTIISNQDYDYMISNSGISKDKLSVISNGLDINHFTPIEKRKEFEIGFIGNMGYRPNILAAYFLIKKILPLVNKKVKTQIAGTRPAQSIRNLANNDIIVTGWMADIRDAYNNSLIFVAPIFTGAGQQNKILEAMAMGLPCVTTVVVNESIKAEHGKEIFVANNENEFAELINTLLEDEDLRNRVGELARKYVEEHYSWETENKKLEELLIKATYGNGS